MRLTRSRPSRHGSSRRAPEGLGEPAQAVRAVAGALVVALAITSVAVGMPETIDRLAQSRHRHVSMGAQELADEAQRVNGLPAGADIYGFWAKHLRPGDRWYMHAPDVAYGHHTLHDTVLVYGLYALLPNVAVSDPRQADVVLTFVADPYTLPVSYVGVARLGRLGVTAARVHR